MYVLQTVLFAVLTIAISGCATVTRGTQDFYEIESEPSGAAVELSNGHTCTTPCGMELPRKHDFTAQISLEGYKPIEVNVVSKQAGAGTAGFAGNVLLGGVIGMVADSTSGAMKDLYPNPLIVELAPEGAERESVVHYPAEKDPEDETSDDEESQAEAVAAAANPDQAIPED